MRVYELRVGDHAWSNLCGGWSSCRGRYVLAVVVESAVVVVGLGSMA